MSADSLPFISATEVSSLLPLDAAMDALEAALRADPAAGGVDPERDGPRLFAPTPHGEFLMMPAQSARYCGIKALTVAPQNPSRGLEKIQGLYLLYSADTSAPLAVLEGASLTAIRTPAVTVSAIRQIARSGALPAAPRVLIFGSGVQAGAHARALALEFPAAAFEFIGRTPARSDRLVAKLGEAPETRGRHLTHVCSGADPGDARIASAVARADIIVCATSSGAPIFDGSLVQSHAIVAAIGTHGRQMREVDDALVARADLVVEGRASARQENGNLVSLSDEQWRGSAAPANLRDLAGGDFTRRPAHPALYTGVGMSWEDLVCATAVFDRHRTSPSDVEA